VAAFVNDFYRSVAGVMMIGIHTYTEAPPVASFVTSKNETIFSNEEILKGQAIFEKYALMEYGSMFGDGANRGPDFTAEALHHISDLLGTIYQSQLKTTENSDLIAKAFLKR
jgi:nitric oxide dismutase